MTNKKRTKIALLFGGSSAEHEISIVTALQAYQALDPLEFETIPVYIAQHGKWYTGEALFKKASYKAFDPDALNLRRVTLLPEPEIQGLLLYGKNNKIDLNQKIEIDACLLCFHGQLGEDGAMQGLLELADLPYTGSPIAASALAMNKSHCKALLSHFGIPTLPWVVVKKKEALINFENVLGAILNNKELTFPLFVKPAQLGSSIGISKALNENELRRALAQVFVYDNEALIEPCLTSLLEINVSVLEGHPPLASVVETPLSSDGALSYEDKYLRGGKNSDNQGMASLQRIIDPKDLDESIKRAVQNYAIKGFSILGCLGLVRFDFMLDLKENRLYFNELNPIPGSLSFYLWEKSHPQKIYTDLLSDLISMAFKRKKETLSLKKNLNNLQKVISA